MAHIALCLVSVVISFEEFLMAETNVAFNTSVTMSSFYGADAPASKAVDGQKIGYWYQDGCACTKKEQNPWMVVDLGAEFTILSVYILNRLDSNSERLSKVHIEIGLRQESMIEMVYHDDVILPDITFEFTTPPCGRYVKIWIEKTEYLTICEIEVNGTESGGGSWTDWSVWSWCSKSCGYGVASRSRSCIGSNCCGETNQTVECNTHECPDTSSESACTYEPRDCQDISTTWSGVYHVTPLGRKNGFDVFCDMETDGGGWLVFQHREDDYVDFDRNWYDYLTGFGDVTGNFWLGLRRLKSIVSQGYYELLVEIVDTNGNHLFAKYDVFSLGDHVDQYQLIVDGYSGNAGDALFAQNFSPFSTKDKDLTEGQCSSLYESGWWFSGCSGPYLTGRHPTGGHGQNSSSWVAVDGNSFYVSKSALKIRRI